MSTSSFEEARYYADPDDTPGDLDTRMVVLRDGRDCRSVFVNDWSEATFDLPPSDGHWVLEGISQIGEEDRENGQTVAVITGTWRPATAQDVDGEDLIAATVSEADDVIYGYANPNRAMYVAVGHHKGERT